jgi:hypothetical protein
VKRLLNDYTLGSDLDANSAICRLACARYF